MIFVLPTLRQSLQKKARYVMSWDSSELNSDLCFAFKATSNALFSTFRLYPSTQSARPFTRNFLCGANRLESSTNMVDSGFILVSFFGVPVGKPKSSFVGVDGAVKKACLVLAGKCFSQTYFWYWKKMIFIVIQQWASDCSL